MSSLADLEFIHAVPVPAVQPGMGLDRVGGR